MTTSTINLAESVNQSLQLVKPNSKTPMHLTSMNEIELIIIDDDDGFDDDQLSNDSDMSILVGENPSMVSPIKQSNLSVNSTHNNNSQHFSTGSTFIQVEGNIKKNVDDTCKSSTISTSGVASTISQRMHLQETSRMAISSGLVTVPSSTLSKNLMSTAASGGNVIMPPCEIAKYDTLHRPGGQHHSNSEIDCMWFKKSASTEAKIKSCSSDLASEFELASPHNDDHHNRDHDDNIHRHDDDDGHHIVHDTSPDSPDSGVSGSVNSADDLKHMDDDEDEERGNRIASVVGFKEAQDGKICDESDLFKEASDCNGTSKIAATATKDCKSSLKKAHCKWLNCDWPGQYEELAEHIRELHVNLQPYLDNSGKVIKWIKKRRSHKDEEDDDCSYQSEPEDGDMDDDDDASDDDSHSVASTQRVTRRSSRGQGLFDYSQSGTAGTVFKTRSNEDSISNGAAIESSERKSQQKYVCLWHGCKVYGKLSSSRQWLERHVLELHSGPKPFKCIVASCGQRFKSQASLQRHVNTHFRPNVSSASTATALDRTINGTADNLRQCDYCCCDCSCHACPYCDTSSTTTPNASLSTLSSATSSSFFSSSSSSSSSSSNGQTPGAKTAPRLLDKNRCESTDSAISLNSSSSDCPQPISLPPTSACLSKPPTSGVFSSNSNISNESIMSQFDEHCHTSCCCRIPANLEYISKANKTKNLKKNVPKSMVVRNFDFYDNFAAHVTLNTSRERQRKAVNMNLTQPAFRKLGLSVVGKKANTFWGKRSNKEVPTLVNLSDDDGESDLDIRAKLKKNQMTKKEKRICLFEEKLFQSASQGPSLLFISEPISTFTPENGDGEQVIRLKWHPPGFLPDTFIKKSQLESNRSRKVLVSDLPDSWQRFLATRKKKLQLSRNRRRNVDTKCTR